MSEHQTAVIKALRNAPGFENAAAQDCRITRLGGLTNLVHLVETGDRQVIVRIPGAGTEAYIDRAVEIHNARVACRAGVSARVLWADDKTGVMISEAIEGIVTMTPELFATRPGAASRAGRALADLHNSPEPFEFRFELFKMIEDYLQVLAQKDAELPDGYHEVVTAAEPLRDLLLSGESTLAPCHCDPLCENFLDDGEKMWIVDWEYSGMNDPLWDLGDLSVEAGLPPALEAELLCAYFGGQPKPHERGRVVIYKAMCDLLWTLWGLIQHADGNPAEDFWAYSLNRFERCQALMNDAEFADHVAAVRSA